MAKFSRLKMARDRVMWSQKGKCLNVSFIFWLGLAWASFFCLTNLDNIFNMQLQFLKLMWEVQRNFNLVWFYLILESVAIFIGADSLYSFAWC